MMYQRGRDLEFLVITAHLLRYFNFTSYICIFPKLCYHHFVGGNVNPEALELTRKKTADKPWVLTEEDGVKCRMVHCLMMQRVDVYLMIRDLSFQQGSMDLES